MALVGMISLQAWGDRFLQRFDREVAAAAAFGRRTGPRIADVDMSGGVDPIRTAS